MTATSPDSVVAATDFPRSLLDQLALQPDALGRFGRFGGKYVPETLMPALSELEAAFTQFHQECGFQEELEGLLRDYVGRPTPLYFAPRLTAYYARPDGTGRDFQAVIGQETRAQCQERWGGLPDILLACVGGGSNAMGLFHAFVADPQVRLIGIEAAGEGVDSSHHAATLTRGQVGVLHGAMSYLLQDEDGQVCEAHSISAGLDYPGVGPEHSYFKETGRAEYYSVTDAAALAAFQRLAQLEGIIPALETAHGIAYLETLCPQLTGNPRIVINCSGRGDKDVQTASKELNLT